jgi:hypothetical protein
MKTRSSPWGPIQGISGHKVLNSLLFWYSRPPRDRPLRLDMTLTFGVAILGLAMCLGVVYLLAHFNLGSW